LDPMVVVAVWVDEKVLVAVDVRVEIPLPVLPALMTRETTPAWLPLSAVL
jgi:hypothetical protein